MFQVRMVCCALLPGLSQPHGARADTSTERGARPAAIAKPGDLAAIVAYLHTVKPLRNPLPDIIACLRMMPPLP